jgi:uncharacterized membrane protein YgcG
VVANWFTHAGFRWALIVLMGLAAILSLALATRSALVLDEPDPDAPAAGLYVTDVEADLGHCVMLATMVLMVIAMQVFIAAAWFRIVLVAFSTCYAIILVVRLARARRVPRPPLIAERAGGAGYHMVAGLAMLATVLPTGDTPTAMPGMVMSGSGSGSGMAMAAAHGGGGGSTGGGSTGGPPVPWLLGILAVFFLIDAAFTVYVAATRRNPAQHGAPLPRSIRLAVVPHVVMDVGMSLMILATL